MDSLFNILAHKNFDEPPEAASIKKFIYDEYKTDVTVTVRDKDISVLAPGAALVNTLRLRAPEMKRRCQIDKKINFRISQ